MNFVKRPLFTVRHHVKIDELIVKPRDFFYYIGKSQNIR